MPSENQIQTGIRRLDEMEESRAFSRTTQESRWKRAVVEAILTEVEEMEEVEDQSEEIEMGRRLIGELILGTLCGNSHDIAVQVREEFPHEEYCEYCEAISEKWRDYQDVRGRGRHRLPTRDEP